MSKKEIIEITKKAVRKDKEVSMVDLLNQEHAKLQKAMIEEILRYLRECSNNAWAKGFDYAEIDNEKLRKFLALFSEFSVVLDRQEYQKYCAYKIIEPQIKGCLDRERELEKQIAELEEQRDSQAYITEELIQEKHRWTEQSRKETAKEILQEVKECKGIKRLVELGYIISYINLCQEIDEIAEQFGVEVKK